MAKTHTLTDNFDDNSIDVSKWTAGSTGTGSSIAETGGQIVVTLPNSSIGYSFIESNLLDLTGSSVTVEFPTKPSGGNGVEQALQARLDSNNHASFKVYSATLEMTYLVGGVPNPTTISREDAAQRWFRLRELGGILYWETSPDRSTWTTQRSMAVAFDLSSVKIRLHGGCWQAVASPGTAAFDNFNLDSPTYRNTAEGQANATALTAANSGGGSGNAFSTVTVTGSLAVTYSTDMSMFGAQSYKVVPNASTALYIRPTTSGAYTGACQMYLYLPTYADTNQLFLAIYNSTGSYPARLSIDATGTVRISNLAGSNVHVSSAGTIPTGQWARLDLSAQVGSGTTDGRIIAQGSLLNSFTPFWSYDSGYTTDTGTDTLAEYRFGKLDTTPNIALFYMDNIAWRNNMIDFIPPESSTPQLAWYTPDQITLADTIMTGANFSVVMTSTPTLGGTLVTPTDTKFRYTGGGNWAFGPTFPDTLMYLPASRYPNTYGYPRSYGVDFIFTGQRFEIYFKLFSTTATAIRVKVNGQRLSDLPQTTGATSVGSRHYYLVDLGRPVTGAVINLELGYFPFGGVAPESGGSILSGISAHTNRVLVQGDSITDGSGENTAGTAGTWPLRLASYMGWSDIWNQAIGGTGFTVAGSSVTILDSARVSDITSNNPTHIMLWAGYNDGATDITSALTSLITQYQTAQPNVPIYIIGTWAPTYPADSYRTSRDSEAEAVAIAKGCYYISPVTGRVRNSTGALVTTLAPLLASSGEVTAYVGSDNVHPNDAGHNHIAKWLYAALKSL